MKQNLRIEEAKTVDALREADLLKARLEVVKAAGNAGGGKRKRVDPDVVPYPRSPKKARRDASPVREVGGMRMLEDDGMFTAMGNAGERDGSVECLTHTDFEKAKSSCERFIASMPV